MLRLQVSASNIANVRSDDPRPGSADAADPASPYVPLQVNQVATADGGTRATVTHSTDAASPNDASGYWDFAANPYIALTNEMVQLLVARFDLTANAKVLHTDAQLSATLLDIKA